MEEGRRQVSHEVTLRKVGVIESEAHITVNQCRAQCDADGPVTPRVCEAPFYWALGETPGI